MIIPGPRNSLTDVGDLLVGQAQDAMVRSGVTVVLPTVDMVAAVDVRGGAPGTRETDALDPTCLVERVHGIFLSGGSAFGLEAGSGLMNWLAANGRGFAVGPARVPVVPGAILFDLLNGGSKDWGQTPPYAALARQAADAASLDVALGNTGAGMGATVAGLKGGLGTASAVDQATGATVGALVVVNAVGSVTMPGQATFWGWYLEQGNEAGGQMPPMLPVDLEFATKLSSPQNTTLAVVATDVTLTKAQALRVALMAHDGLARAIRPLHTPYDGDTVFALSTTRRPLGDQPDALLRIGAMAADCLTRAVMRGIYAAADLGDHRSYRSVHGALLRQP